MSSGGNITQSTYRVFWEKRNRDINQYYVQKITEVVLYKDSLETDFNNQLLLILAIIRMILININN